jgi:hypothetical protein
MSRNRGGEGVKKMEMEWELDQGWDRVWDSPRRTLT